MTLLYVDGFDHYATSLIPRRYSIMVGAPAISTATKRTGYSSLNTTGSSGERVRLSVPASATLIVGFGFYYTFMDFNDGIISFDHITTGYLSHCALIGSQGVVYVARRASSLGGWFEAARHVALSDAFYIPANSWVYLEMKLTISDAAGAAEVRMNGNTMISIAGVDTKEGASTVIESITIGEGNSSSNYFYDDLYVCDTNGAVNNDFIGDRKVETLLASGAGTYAGWTPSAGSNYQNVDEQNCDDDTTYNSAAAAGLPLTDSHAMGNLAAVAGNIAGVQSVIVPRNDDAGPSTLHPFFRIGGADYVGTGFNPGGSYLFNFQIYETSPATASAWSIAEVNGAEFGYRRSA